MNVSRSSIALVSVVTFGLFLNIGCGLPVVSGYFIYKAHYALTHKKAPARPTEEVTGRPVIIVGSDLRGIDAARLTAEEASSTRTIAIRIVGDLLSEEEIRGDRQQLADAIGTAALEMFEARKTLSQLEELSPMLFSNIADHGVASNAANHHAAQVFVARFVPFTREQQFNSLTVEVIPAACSEADTACVATDFRQAGYGADDLVVNFVTRNFRVRVIYGNTPVEAEAPELTEGQASVQTETRLVPVTEEAAPSEAAPAEPAAE